MKNKKNFLRPIFAFLTAFFLLTAVLSWGFFAIGSPSVILALLEKSDYAKKAALEAYVSLNFIGQAGGFEEDFFDGIITKSDIENNLIPFINSSLKGENFTADDTKIKEKISRKIFLAAEEKMSGYSEETRQILEQTVSLCTKEALSHSAPDIIGYFCRFYGRFKGLFLAFATVFSLLFISSFFILKKQSRRYLKTALISAFLMLGTAPSAVLVFLNLRNLGIDRVSLKDFIILFVFFLLIGFIFAAVFTLIASFFIRKKGPASN